MNKNPGEFSWRIFGTDPQQVDKVRAAQRFQLQKNSTFGINLAKNNP